MTLQAQKNADKALAKAIYASNSPFSLVTNDYWQAAFKALRPSYKPPSRYSLAGPLLDAEYEAATVSVNNSIEKASCITLVTDGWTNVEGESVMNFVLCTPSPLFFKSINTGNNRHTAAYMAEEICAVMESVGSSKVKALVTDNASNMKAAWALVIERFPHVTAIGCATHSLNLLMNDLLTLGTIHDVHKQAKDIIKYVKKTHVVLATFKERQESKYGKSVSCSLKLPSKTRWSGVCLSFESLLKNMEVLQEIAIMENLKFDKTLRLVVLDEEEFWVALKSCHTLLEPIAKAIKALEGDGALLSDVTNFFHNLEEEIHSNLQRSVLSQSEQDLAEKALKTRKVFTVHPVNCAANLLDPKIQGEKSD
nr:uncharacterized protein LOC129382786 [Dermacentor andersoni]